MAYVLAVSTIDMLMYFEKPGHRSPFLHPTLGFLRENPRLMHDILHIDHIFNRRQQDNPRVARYETTDKNYTRYFPMFYNCVSDENAHLNTPENRERWARQVLAFINSDTSQHRYTYPIQVVYGGDVTPSQGDYPHPSEYLIFNDTIRVLTDAFTDYEQDGNPIYPSGADLATNSEAVNAYFEPALRQDALARLTGADVNLHPEGNQNQQGGAPADPYAAFQFAFGNPGP